MSEKIHTTKDGRKIKICEMTTNHLQNYIRLIELKAKNGFVVRSGGGTCAEDMWMDEKTYYGNDVKRIFNYKDYKEELEKRI